MTFPQRGIEIIRALYTASPQDDEARRRDIQKVGEQMAHDLGPQWGNKKRAGVSDALRSPDSIAFLEADLTCSVWDIQASNGAILVHAGKPPDYPNLGMGEATFMPCDPKNHLAGNPIPGEVPPTPGTAVDLGPVLAELAAIKALIEKLGTLHGAFPNYEAEITSGPWYARNTTKVTLTPEAPA